MICAGWQQRSRGLPGDSAEVTAACGGILQRLKQSVTYRGAAAENGTRLAGPQVASSRGQLRGNQQRRPGDLTRQASSQVEADPDSDMERGGGSGATGPMETSQNEASSMAETEVHAQTSGRGFFPFPFFYPTQIRNLRAASDQDTSCVQIRVAKQILIDSSTYFFRLE